MTVREPQQHSGWPLFGGWALSLALHTVVILSVAQFLGQIEAPPPPQVSRWEVSLVEQAQPTAAQKPASTQSENTSMEPGPARRVADQQKPRMVRVPEHVTSRPVAHRIVETTPTVTNVRSLPPRASPREPARQELARIVRTRTQAPIVATAPLAERATEDQPATRNLEPVKEQVAAAVSGRRAAHDPVARRTADATETKVVEVSPRSHAEEHVKLVALEGDVTSPQVLQASTAEVGRSVVEAVERPGSFRKTASTAPRRVQSSPSLVAVTQSMAQASVTADSPEALRSISREPSAVKAPDLFSTKLLNEALSGEARAFLPPATVEKSVPISQHVVAALLATKKVAVQPQALFTKAAASTRTDYGWLATQMHQRVARLKRYPFVARVNMLEGKVVLRAVIREDGHVADVSVRHSSGHKILDQEAIELIHRVSPLHLNHPLGRPKVIMHIPITFNLQ